MGANALVLLGLMLTSALPGQGPVWRGDLEADHEVWTLTGGARWSEQQARSGRYAAELAITAERAGALLSPQRLIPTGAARAGFAAWSRAQGALHAEILSTGEAPVVEWTVPLEGDGRWHDYAVTCIGLPVGAPGIRLRLTARGEAGSSVFVDDIRLARTAFPESQTPSNTWQPPRAELPAGWRAEGLEDAIERKVGNGVERYVTVGGVEVSAPEQLECYAGFRTGVPLYLLNRGSPEKLVNLGAQCPPGLRNDAAPVKLKGDAALGARPPLQSLLPGAAMVRLWAQVGDSKQALPLMVRARRAFPAFGVSTDPARLEADLPRWASIPAQMVYVQGLPPEALPRTGGLGPAVVAGVPLDVSAHQAQPEQFARLQEALESHADDVDLWEVVAAPGADERAAPRIIAALRTASKLVRQYDTDGLICSPKLGAAVHRAGSPEGRLLAALLQEGLTEYVHCLLVEAPAISAGAVVEEQKDGRPWRGVSWYWADFDRSVGLDVVEGLMASQRAFLPVLVQGLAVPPSGLDWVDALKTMRTAAALTSNGLTGIAWAGDPRSNVVAPPADGAPPGPALQAWEAMLPELCTAAPAIPPDDTKQVSRAPGTEVTVKALQRGQEGIAALWNNTRRAVELELQVPHPPIEQRVCRFAPGSGLKTTFRAALEKPKPKTKPAGTLAERAEVWEPPGLREKSKTKTKEERFRKSHMLRIQLEPLGVAVVSLRFVGPYPTWLERIRVR